MKKIAARVLTFTLFVSGCAPAAGPTTFALESQAFSMVKAPSRLIDYVLVDVTEEIALKVSRESSKRIDGYFSNQNPPARVTIGRGDVLSITVFESGSGGLFIPSGITLSQGNYVKLPDQEIGSDGFIKVQCRADGEYDGLREGQRLLQCQQGNTEHGAV